MTNKTEQEMKRYLRKKESVLKVIASLAETYNYGSSDYDYFLTDDDEEYLLFFSVLIPCTGNSDTAIINELIGFIMLNHTLEYFDLNNLIVKVGSEVKRRWICRYSNQATEILQRKIA